jgi:hypothetical protein
MADDGIEEHHIWGAQLKNQVPYDEDNTALPALSCYCRHRQTCTKLKLRIDGLGLEIQAAQHNAGRVSLEFFVPELLRSFRLDPIPQAHKLIFALRRRRLNPRFHSVHGVGTHRARNPNLVIHHDEPNNHPIEIIPFNGSSC